MFLRLFYNKRTSDFIASASLLIWLAVNIFWINICFWATKLEIGDSSSSHNPCNRARFGNRTRIKSSSRPTELINICSRATKLDIYCSGRRGKYRSCSIKDYQGKEIILKTMVKRKILKNLVFPVSKLART